MSTNQRDGRHNRDQKDRIHELQKQAEQASGGQMTVWESDTLSPDLHEQFWRSVMEYESAPATSHFQLLSDAGLNLPEPDPLDDDQLTLKLWEVMAALARVRATTESRRRPVARSGWSSSS